MPLHKKIKTSTTTKKNVATVPAPVSLNQSLKLVVTPLVKIRRLFNISLYYKKCKQNKLVICLQSFLSLTFAETRKLGGVKKHLFGLPVLKTFFFMLASFNGLYYSLHIYMLFND